MPLGLALRPARALQQGPLEGVVSGNADNPVITVPAGGVVQNATGGFGTLYAAQVLVQNPSAVNISNIAIDGTGNGITACSGSGALFVVGIYYQNASGTVNHVSTRKQLANGCGIGIVVENISGVSQAVTVENSIIHDFDIGIDAFTDTGTQPIISILSNDLVGANQFTPSSSSGIFLFTPATVSGNIISDVFEGMFVCCTSAVTITKNTIQAAGIALNMCCGGPFTITSNTLFRNGTGIALCCGVNNTLVQKNIITNTSSSSGPGIGVDAGCSGTHNTITSNTFDDVGTALNNIPLSGGDVTTPNSNFNVTTIKTTC